MPVVGSRLNIEMVLSVLLTVYRYCPDGCIEMPCGKPPTGVSPTRVSPPVAESMLNCETLSEIRFETYRNLPAGSVTTAPAPEADGSLNGEPGTGVSSP